MFITYFWKNIKYYEINIGKPTVAVVISAPAKIIKDKDLLKASSDFFNIGKGCYGGRLKKAKIHLNYFPNL